MENFTKNSHLKLIVLSSLTIVFTGLKSGAATSDYYKCVNRVSGEWNYGRAPSACDAKSFGDDSVVNRDYSQLIFQDTAVRIEERTRYMTELNALIRDAATYYIKKRKPTVGTEELSWWVLAMQTTASQESYWSHYRLVDNRIKMMRGDVGHGHGMMQIDDRAHFNAIKAGIAWNLITNMTYGMDIFYSAWIKSLSVSCVSSATNYTARVRSAWAAYNGGPGSICRWTNSSSSWAQNDKNFYNNLTQRRWQAFVTDATKPSSVDAICLMEKQENCAAPGNGTPGDNEPAPALQSGILYKNISDNKHCVIRDNQAHCVQNSRDSICLLSVDTFNTASVMTVKDEVLNTYHPVVLDRHEVCADYDAYLIKVGSDIRLIEAINLRSTPGGGMLTTIPAGKVLEVLDFEIRDSKVNDHYYKVTYGSKTGFIYAGDKTDYSKWVVAVEPEETPELPTTVAKVGQTVKLVIAINLRTTAGGNLIKTIPAKTQLQVLEVVTQGSENKIYYKVKYGSSTGYIYTGLLLPSSTVNDWTVVVQ